MKAQFEEGWLIPALTRYTAEARAQGHNDWADAMITAASDLVRWRADIIELTKLLAAAGKSEVKK